MFAPIQKKILSEIVNNEKIYRVFDPFHGSGTSLYESLEISNNLHLYGCDINPLANLITKVKLKGVNSNINRDIELLIYYLSKNRFNKKYEFHNIDKWFRDDIATDLKKIKYSISKINNKQNRLYFWCMLCDVIRKYSNTRSSTYKLHIKDKDSINNLKNNVIEDYISSVKKNVYMFQKSSSNFKIFKCNVLNKIKEFSNEYFDISITSPPYGDNATTVTYGQFSMLALQWIDRKDLELEGWEYDNYSKIDSNSLGGCFSSIDLKENDLSLIYSYLNKISDKKKNKVLKFFSDYFLFLNQLCRVTKKYIVMTLGNRTVDGVNINLTNITLNYLDNNNFKNIKTIERKIPSKRIPSKTSRVNNRPVSSMNYEYIIINKKI